MQFTAQNLQICQKFHPREDVRIFTVTGNYFFFQFFWPGTWRLLVAIALPQTKFVAVISGRGRREGGGKGWAPSPPSLPILRRRHPPLRLEGLGSGAHQLPSRSRRSLAARHILVHLSTNLHPIDCLMTNNFQCSFSTKKFL